MSPNEREDAAVKAAEDAARDRRRLTPPTGYRLVASGPSFAYFLPVK
jgi:hypothetical protein